MGLRFDKFTWVVIGVVGLLLVAALLMATLRNEPGQVAYQTEDAPATPVYNVFVALRKGDLVTARQQYSQRVLDEQKKNNYDPLSSRGYSDDRTARRLRILTTAIDASDPNKATVEFAVDTYYAGGLFRGGDTASYRRTVAVVREEGRWKLDTDEYFFY
jgi:hypothetical protein